jgi:hypothetical protein
MIGEDIRLTRCTTCDTEHDYKHARVPRVRKKTDVAFAPALAAPTPRRIVPEPPAAVPPESVAPVQAVAPPAPVSAVDDEVARVSALLGVHRGDGAHAPETPDNSADGPLRREEGPVHRQLIRAQLPRLDGQPPAPRQAPDFTIRQPGGRPNRFRNNHQRGGFGGGYLGGPSGNGHGYGNRSQGNGQTRGNGPRTGGRPPMGGRAAQRQNNNGRKRSK